MLHELPKNYQTVIQHRLLVKDERGNREYHLTDSTYAIGKASRADIRLYTQSLLVAPRHATLVLLIENGTSSYRLVKEELAGVLDQQKLLVNGNPIQIHRLQEGDTITFASNVIATYHYTCRIELLPAFDGCILFDPKIVS